MIEDNENKSRESDAHEDPDPAEDHEETSLQVERELEREHEASQFVDQRIVFAWKWQSSLGPVHGQK